MVEPLSYTFQLSASLRLSEFRNEDFVLLIVAKPTKIKWLTEKKTFPY